MTNADTTTPERGGLRGLLDFLSAHRARGLALASATVVETTGATYRKPGATMLIARDGVFRGLLSGGCLEGDLAAHAVEVLEGGASRVIEYDLEAMTDAVFGFGLGCDGSVRVLLERLDAESDWNPFATIVRLAMQSANATVRRVIDSRDPILPVGTWCIESDAGHLAGDAGLAGDARVPLGRPLVYERPASTGRVRILATRLPHIPRLVLLGAAPDAGPVVRLAVAMGWRIAVADHRAGFLEAGHLADADEVRHIAHDDDLERKLDLPGADAVLIMSHNLEADARYLRAALASDVAYIGLLGPAGRRSRLIEMCEVASERERIYGPVGLDLGGDGPEAIALAIVAEIQKILHGRSGAHRDEARG